MALKLKLDGFEQEINKLVKAGKDADKFCKQAIEIEAQIMESELKSQMTSAGVPSDLVNSMPKYTTSSNGNVYSARVGYNKGTYNPDNLSDGYKVVFLNYGTPRRSKHGKIADGGKIRLGFIARAKNSANRKISRKNNEIFKKIMGG